MTPAIRLALMADAPAIAQCLLALGHDRYTVLAEDVAQRLAQLQTEGAAVLVVELPEQGVVGVCHIAGVRNLSTTGYAEIMELAVREDCQGQGVGTALIHAAKDWAQCRGFARLRLRSGVHRVQAHAFYERLGFRCSRASYAFEQTLV
ncbi:GNAT family N-acetyltransferase [Silvimonas amylolytica]|uniref:N-acetyltransferase n=1 Tax=Silvimonas amylolytica TaxID=449663 RepID=A0ABQ2PKX5_9NEIS|nr:GNAT family N-acetyltransferase [Silvimonas amylolytica]GGP25866.1 N-acetyltransferase [Silvimonas amylolytica]